MGSISLRPNGLLFAPRGESAVYYPLQTPASLNLHFRSQADLPFSVLPGSFKATPQWCRNVDLLAIAYAFRPRLRIRLTLGGLTFPRKPWASGVPVSHRHYRYSCQHSHFQNLQQSSRSAFTGDWNAPLPIHPTRRSDRSRGFGGMLEPRYIFGAGSHRPVSCYAFFKGWLLLSQPPGCQCAPTSFPT